MLYLFYFFFQAEDGIRDRNVTGVQTCALPILLGATWLVMKTEGPVAEHSRRQARLLLLVVLAFLAIVSVWTPIAFERIRSEERRVGKECRYRRSPYE